MAKSDINVHDLDIQAEFKVDGLPKPINFNNLDFVCLGMSSKENVYIFTDKNCKLYDVVIIDSRVKAIRSV